MVSSEIFGIPGSTIRNLQGQKFQKGWQGEWSFFRTLQREGLLDAYDSFWSLGIGNNPKTEIDCILASGSKLLLIDVKNWNFQHNTYTQVRENKIVKRECGREEPLETYHLGYSLHRGQQTLRTWLPDLSVGTATVFLTSDRQGVSKINWPGSAITVTTGDLIKSLGAHFPAVTPSTRVRDALIPHLDQQVIFKGEGVFQGLLF